MGTTAECKRGGGSRSTVKTKERPDGTKTSAEQSYAWHQGTIETVVKTLGVSGIIAILIIGTSCSLTMIQVYRGGTPELPKFLYEFSLLVLGFYFGQKSKSEIKEIETPKRSVGFRQQDENNQ